jgi:general secretion pathway protein B
MSYILDALRKADAERERDPARGIHAQPLAARTARGAAGLPVWVWPVAAGAVVLAAGATLWPREAPVAAPVAPAVPLAVPAAAPVARAPATVAVADSVSPPAPPPVPAPVQRAVARAPSASPAATAAPALAVPLPAASAQPAVAPAADRVFAVNELPPEVQRDLPRLAISGGVHSENAAQRMLIVGGQVMSEGAELAPGVVLEQIRAHTAVLRFRGYRYAVGY